MTYDDVRIIAETHDWANKNTNEQGSCLLDANRTMVLFVILY